MALNLKEINLVLRIAAARAMAIAFASLLHDWCQPLYSGPP